MAIRPKISAFFFFTGYKVKDWIEEGLTSHSTHLGHFRDGGVTAASARIVAAVRAHSVCGIE